MFADARFGDGGLEMKRRGEGEGRPRRRSGGAETAALGICHCAWNDAMDAAEDSCWETSRQRIMHEENRGCVAIRCIQTCQVYSIARVQDEVNAI